jgi:hypothetical protein
MIVCDFCGRSDDKYSNQTGEDDPRFDIDEDGLWVCHQCQENLTSAATSSLGSEETDEWIRKLVGKSAGAICRTLNLPYAPPYQAIIDAAAKIAYDEDRHMSAWLLTDLWMDGSTVWLSGDKLAKAIVYPNAEIEFKRDFR